MKRHNNKENIFEKELRTKDLWELLYIFLSIIGSLLLFRFILSTNLFEFYKEDLFVAFFLFLFGIIHLIGNNILSFFYNITSKLMPYFNLPIKITPKRLRIFGCGCLIAALFVMASFLIGTPLFHAIWKKR